MKYNTMYNTEPRKSTAQKSKKGSLAIPGQSFSLAQAIERIRAGLPVKALSYGYNPDGFPKVDDLTTIEQFKKTVQAKLETVNNKIAEIKASNKARSEAEGVK